MKLIKGDSKTIIIKSDESIANWKIRCEIYDNCGNCIKLATSNSGGSDTQIEKLDSLRFAVYIPSDSTKDFNNQSFIEVEVDTGNTVGGNPEILTVLKERINFDCQRIKWSTPNE